MFKLLIRVIKGEFISYYEIERYLKKEINTIDRILEKNQDYEVRLELKGERVMCINMLKDLKSKVI